MSKRRANARKPTDDMDSPALATITKFYKIQNPRNHQPPVKSALFFEGTGAPMSLISSDYQYTLPQVDGSAGANVGTLQQNIIFSPTNPASATSPASTAGIQSEEAVAVNLIKVRSSTTGGEPSIGNEVVETSEVTTENKEKLVVEIGTQDGVMRSDKGSWNSEDVPVHDSDDAENSLLPLQQLPVPRTTFGDTSTILTPSSPNTSCTATEDTDDGVQIINDLMTIPCGRQDNQNFPTTIVSLEMKNFMGCTYKKINFSKSTILNEPFCKSTVIIGLLLALGQDDILKVYGYKLMDVIKIGESIAFLKLKANIKGPEFGDSIVISKPVLIQRKFQVDNDVLLPCVWKVKSAAPFVQVKECILLKDIVPCFMILRWMTGIPIVITPLIIYECLNRPFSFWYKEFKMIEQTIPKQNEMALEKLMNDLEAKRRCLMDRQELHKIKFQDVEVASMSRDALVDIVADKDAITKLELCVKNSEAKLDSLKAKLQEQQTKLSKQFICRYRTLSAALGLKGDCVVDTTSEEIICAVWTKLAVCNGHELKQQFAVSSLKYKSLALVVLITCFWEEMTEAPFFVVDAQNLLEEYATEFKKLIESRPLQQLIFA